MRAPGPLFETMAENGIQRVAVAFRGVGGGRAIEPFGFRSGAGPVFPPPSVRALAIEMAEAVLLREFPGWCDNDGSVGIVYAEHGRLWVEIGWRVWGWKTEVKEVGSPDEHGELR